MLWSAHGPRRAPCPESAPGPEPVPVLWWAFCAAVSGRSAIIPTQNAHKPAIWLASSPPAGVPAGSGAGILATARVPAGRGCLAAGLRRYLNHRHRPRSGCIGRLFVMSEARGEPRAAAEDIAELQRALSTGDTASARRAATQLRESGDDDDALALLAHYAAGSAPVTELLVEALDASGVVHRFAADALLDKSAVDDVSQDALISIAESIGSYGGRGKVTTWVHSIVRRRVVDHLRRQRDNAPLPDDDAAPGVRMSSMIATRTTVQEALAALPELYREPITLRDLEGLAYAEVAEKLGRSLGTVKSQVSRGRAMVAARLQTAGDVEDQ